jgi:hypothetical protein
MAITINSISCEEIVADYGEGAQLSGLSSRKGYLCDWTDRFTVAKGLLGLATTTGVGGAITLVSPSRHPELYNCYCTGVEFQPMGTPSQGTYQVTWPKVIVWASYGSLTFNWGTASIPYMDIDPSTPFIYAEQQIDVGCEVITVPNKGLRFATSLRRLDQDFGFRIALVDMKITLHRVPYLPGAAIIAKAGAINDATYLGVSAGQLLFNGASNSLQLGADGTWTQDITYSFTARQYPWDYSYDGVAKAWRKVVQTDGSNFITRQSLVGLFPDEYSS